MLKCSVYCMCLISFCVLSVTTEHMFVYDNTWKHGATTPADSCPERCNCTEDMRANCRNRAFKWFLQGLSKQTLWLNFQNNRLSSLRRDSLENLTNLQYLDLSKNKLTLIDSTAFAKLSNLTELKLNSNLFDDLPSFLFSPLRSLRTLHLSNNRFAYNREAFINLSSLIELRMNDVRFDTFPVFHYRDRALLPSLTDLELKGNFFRFIEPNMLKGLKSLKSLVLTRNQIQYVSPNTFSRTKIESLVLDRNHPLSNLNPDSFRSSFLRKLSLDLSGFTLMKGISSIFQQITNLEVLNLANTALKDRVEEIAFQNLTNVLILGLSNVNMGGKLPVAMLSNTTKLKWLYMSNTNIGASIDNRFFQNVTNSLKHLNMANNKLAVINRTSLPTELWDRLKGLTFLVIRSSATVTSSRFVDG